jgi:hypothetical protein
MNSGLRLVMMTMGRTVRKTIAVLKIGPLRAVAVKMWVVG